MTDQPRDHPLIINLGLPRTGTTSLHDAATSIGMRSLHVWSAAEHDPAVLRDFTEGREVPRRYVASFDVVGDTPFYALRSVVERLYPDSLLVATTRPVQEWVRSMIRHRTAGGEFFRRHFDMDGLPHLPEDASALAAIHERHYAELGDLPSIDLADPDETRRWSLLCSVLSDPIEGLRRVDGAPWPHSNPSRAAR